MMECLTKVETARVISSDQLKRNTHRTKRSKSTERRELIKTLVTGTASPRSNEETINRNGRKWTKKKRRHYDTRTKTPYLRASQFFASSILSSRTV